MAHEHSAASSDHEQFEDAADDSSTPQTLGEPRSRSSNSTRSLTDSPSRKASEADAAEDIPEEEATPRVPQAETLQEKEHAHAGAEHLTSPPSTAKRHAKNPSTTSFAEVHLDENPSPTSQGAHPPSESSPEAATPHVATERGRTDSATPSVTQTSDRSESRQSRQSSVSSRPGSNRSSVPTGAMPPPSKPAMPQPARTFSSPFNWFQRKKTASTASIPQTPGTRASLATQPELKLEGLGEESNKESLKERFKQLRMKEEAGIEIQKVTSPEATTPGGVGLGIDTSVGGAGADDNASTKSPAPSTDRDSVVSYSATPRRPSSASTVNTDLLPGTVVGAQTGPAPIDWDLWQNVVNEGPTAVAKSTPAELNKAIASGIPSTIRGVVWQVFAQSEDKGLEMKYWELVHRGTDKDVAKSPGRSPSVTPGVSPVDPAPNGSVTTTESADSASVHSETSTPATTNGVSSPSLDVPAPMDPKAQAEQAKKAKEDLAALKKLEKTIRKDLGSRSNYSRYASSANLQDGLFNVCKAYALYDTDVGYAQGMNFIVMPLLFNMPEEEAFCLMVRLMHHYRVRDMFIQDMPGLHLHIEQFSRLLEDSEPALAHHLRKRGITPQLYATQWFLTLFAYRFPLQLVLRIYDLVLSEGFESAILKFALALMRKNATSLMAIKDMSGLKTFLNERLFDAYIDKAPSAGSLLENGFFGFAGNGSVDREIYRADLLVEDACAIQIDHKELDSLSRDFKAKVKEEKERDEELARLRREHAQYSTRIKELEKHAQKTDADHVELTNQMLASKMENEDLKQQVVDLEVECNELKLSVASLPAEIERGLQDEMDANRKRCEEMQAQVSRSEEEKQEYESQVIDIKMQWATLNGEHEQLKQKWTDLRRALGD